MINPISKLFRGFFTIYIFSLLCSINTHAQTYAVFNASSTPGANGIYIEDGAFNSMPKYTNGDYVLFYGNQNMKWAIVATGTDLNTDDFSNSPYLYSTPMDLNHPPQKGWHSGGNTTGSPGENIVVTELNSIGFSKNWFVESSADNGTIKDTALFYIFSNDITFSGTNDDDFIAANKMEIANLPSGLTAKAIRKSDSKISIFFDGTSESHTMKDNTDSLILIVKNEALSNNDISVISNDSIGLNIMYQNPYYISGITSNASINGCYKLEGVFNLKPFYKFNNYYLMTKGCNPKWIIREKNNVHPLYSSQVNHSFPHNREWHNGGFYFIINDDVNLAMENSIHYTNYSFVESLEDNGEFADSIEIQYCQPYNGGSFSGVAGDDFVADGKVNVTNLPEGLSLELKKHNDTTLYAKLTGQETNHELSNNINNLKIEFTETAFNGSGIFATNLLSEDSLSVVHMSNYVVVDTTNFLRNANGIYSAYDMINDKPAYSNQNGYYLIRRTKSSGCCVWSVLKRGSQNAVFRNEELSDTPPGNNWIVGDWSGSSTATIEVFQLQPWISYSKLSFSETSEDNGTISDTVTVSINHADGNVFNGSIGEDFFASDKVSVKNVPEGLNPKLEMVNDTCIYFIFSGEAAQHHTDNDINSISIDFKGSAFSGSKGNIKYSAKYNFSISFNHISGLNPSANEEQVPRVFPNPATNSINIKIDNIQGARLNIIDISGKGVYSKVPNSNNELIDLSTFKKGIYLVKVIQANKTYIEKVIVQ